MADSRVVREVVIRGKTEGLDQIASGLAKVDHAQQGVARSALEMAKASETASRSQITAARQFDRVQASVDQTFAATQKFSAGQAAADRALRLGVVTSQDHANVLDGLARKYGVVQQSNDNFTHSVGSNRAAMLELGHVAKASFESLASGAPIMTVLAQQGASAAQAFIPRPMKADSRGGFRRWEFVIQSGGQLG